EGLNLRSNGFTYRQIARAQKVQVATAHDRVQRAIRRERELAPETPEEVRELELIKLDRMERALMPAAATGDPSAVRLVLRIIDTRQRLMKAAAKEEADFA